MGIFQDWVSVGSKVAVWTEVQVKSLATVQEEAVKVMFLL